SWRLNAICHARHCADSAEIKATGSRYPREKAAAAAHREGSAIMTVQDTQATEFTAEWERWHKQHEDRLAAPDGFLAITSINWLSETPARFADAPGAWTAAEAGGSVLLDDGEG